MTPTLKHIIEAAALEHDLDELGRLLCRFELDDEIRAAIYAAMDRCNDAPVLLVDEVFVLGGAR